MKQSRNCFALLFLVCLLLCRHFDCFSWGGLFSGKKLGNSTISTSNLKKDILERSRKVEGGLTETAEDRAQIISIFESLEKLNPIAKPLLSDDVNAIWKLEYTTSDSILGRNGFRKEGSVYQKIDAKNLQAENSEVINVFGIKVPRKVTAQLTPITDSKVAVKFQVFSVGPISFKAPESARGELDITYLDKDLRLSRGDKGSLFVLTKYSSI